MIRRMNGTANPEFGFRSMQMRARYLVKNATVFEVLSDNCVTEVLYHGDVDEDDIVRLAETGRRFLVFWEGYYDEGWMKFYLQNGLREEPPSLEINIPVAEFTEFARIVIDNYDFVDRLHGAEKDRVKIRRDYYNPVTY